MGKSLPFKNPQPEEKSLLDTHPVGSEGGPPGMELEYWARLQGRGPRTVPVAHTTGEHWHSSDRLVGYHSGRAGKLERDTPVTGN